MPLKITHSDLARFASQADRMKAAGQKIKSKTETALRQVVRTTELNAVAFGASVLKGKVGEVAVVGVPLEIAVGLGGHLAGFFGLGGSMSQHLHNLADGALVSWTCGRGISVGAGMRTPEDVARIAKHAEEQQKKLDAKRAAISGDLDGRMGTRIRDGERSST